MKQIYKLSVLLALALALALPSMAPDTLEMKSEKENVERRKP
jgi:hypothetical protein